MPSAPLSSPGLTIQTGKRNEDGTRPSVSIAVPRASVGGNPPQRTPSIANGRTRRMPSIVPPSPIVGRSSVMSQSGRPSLAFAPSAARTSVVIMPSIITRRPSHIPGRVSAAGRRPSEAPRRPSEVPGQYSVAATSRYSTIGPYRPSVATRRGSILPTSPIRSSVIIPSVRAHRPSLIITPSTRRPSTYIETPTLPGEPLIQPTPPSPRAAWAFRSLVFVLCGFALFGISYSYNLPASINTPLHHHLGSTYEEYQWQINLLYTVYSLPNFILPLLGGMLIDALGHRTMLVVFSFVIVAGQALFAVGTQIKNFDAMVVGRSILGTAADSVEIASTVVSTDWFQGRYLALALAMHSSLAGAAGVAGDNISPRLKDVVRACWVSVGICGVGLVCASFLAILDSEKFRLRFGALDDEGGGEPALLEPVEFALGRDSDMSKRTGESEATYVGSESSSGQGGGKGEKGEKGEGASSEEIESAADLTKWAQARIFVSTQVRQILDLPPAFWLLCLATVTIYGSYGPFYYICVDFFQEKWWPGDHEHAAFVMSSSDMLSTIGCPILGLMIDRFGARSILLTLSSLLLLTAHLLFTFTNTNPLISMMIMGLASSTFPTIIWSSVSLLVDRSQLATAYGMIYVCINIALSVVPLGVAEIRSKSADFVGVGWLFIGLSVVAASVSVGLGVVDARNGFVMHKSGRELEEEAEREWEEEVGITVEEFIRSDVEGGRRDSLQGVMANKGRRYTMANLDNLQEDDEKDEGREVGVDEEFGTGDIGEGRIGGDHV
ncbi:hypothetical protein HK097_003644 [Rhizophlyctis rosea]|uniref:Lysosomal dipeptide transporter MFSD1 n=1 Tax=Rhizophlyctis rosea TaxID=64517 RepID=A0AAD5S9K5_9FUNG|nr:hypothetical protein HK097_003644 [Rhizophlyctis rosea]